MYDLRTPVLWKECSRGHKKSPTAETLFHKCGLPFTKTFEIIYNYVCYTYRRVTCDFRENEGNQKEGYGDRIWAGSVAAFRDRIITALSGAQVYKLKGKVYLDVCKPAFISNSKFDEGYVLGAAEQDSSGKTFKKVAFKKYKHRYACIYPSLRTNHFVDFISKYIDHGSEIILCSKEIPIELKVRLPEYTFSQTLDEEDFVTEYFLELSFLSNKLKLNSISAFQRFLDECNYKYNRPIENSSSARTNFYEVLELMIKGHSQNTNLYIS